MGSETKALATLIAKDEIRELAMLYSRGIDRKDIGLLRTLYARGGTDDHGEFYNGAAEGFCDQMATSLPPIPYTGHHICNHLISVDGESGEGELYAIALHINPDGQGGYVEDIMTVRYLDHYRKEDGRWKFAARRVSFDTRVVRPYDLPEPRRDGELDMSYDTLTSRIFARGTRA